MAGNIYRLADGRFASLDAVRAAVASARGQASASGRRPGVTRSGRTIEEIEEAIRLGRIRARKAEEERKAREADKERKAREAEERRKAPATEKAREDDWHRPRRRPPEPPLLRVTRRARPRRMRTINFKTPLLPRTRYFPGGLRFGPPVAADGFASLVLRTWSVGTHTHRGTGLFAAKARYILDPEKLDDAPGRAIFTNLVARGQPGNPGPCPYDPEWTEELLDRCHALEQFERDVARREKGRPRAQLFVHVMVALPFVAEPVLRSRAASAVVERIDRAGLPYLAVMQRPSNARGRRDGRNFHLHLLVANRPAAALGREETLVSPLKDHATLGPEGMRAWRRDIVDGFNEVLADAGLPQRYTALTLAERGLDRRGRRIATVPVPQPPAPGRAAAARAAIATLARHADHLAKAAGALGRLAHRLDAARERLRHASALRPARADRIEARLAGASDRLDIAIASRLAARDARHQAIQQQRSRWGRLSFRRLQAETSLASDRVERLGRMISLATAFGAVASQLATAAAARGAGLAAHHQAIQQQRSRWGLLSFRGLQAGIALAGDRGRWLGEAVSDATRRDALAQRLGLAIAARREALARREARVTALPRLVAAAGERLGAAVFLKRSAGGARVATLDQRHDRLLGLTVRLVFASSMTGFIRQDARHRAIGQRLGRAAETHGTRLKDRLAAVAAQAQRLAALGRRLGHGLARLRGEADRTLAAADDRGDRLSTLAGRRDEAIRQRERILLRTRRQVLKQLGRVAQARLRLRLAHLAHQHGRLAQLEARLDAAHVPGAASAREARGLGPPAPPPADRLPPHAARQGMRDRAPATSVPRLAGWVEAATVPDLGPHETGPAFRPAWGDPAAGHGLPDEGRVGGPRLRGPGWSWGSWADAPSPAPGEGFRAALEAGAPLEVLEEIVRSLREDGMAEAALAQLPHHLADHFERIAEDQEAEEARARAEARRRRDAGWERTPWDD